MEDRAVAGIHVKCLFNLVRLLELLVLVDSIINIWKVCLLTMLKLTLTMNKLTLIKIMLTS